MEEMHAYEKIVREAIAVLPPKIREEVKDVVIVFREQPPRERIKRGHLLLGLYEGVPLTSWGRDYSGKLPDTITLFLGPIRTVAGVPEEVPRVLRETVWHEIGHHFGLDHDRIGAMERRWRKKRERET